jgi:hypothetical protein
MTDQPSDDRVLDEVLERTGLSIAAMAAMLGATTAQLEAYRTGEEPLPADVLRKTLPEALRAHSRELMALAAEAEATPVPSGGPRPTIRTQLIAEVMEHVEKKSDAAEAEGDDAREDEVPKG